MRKQIDIALDYTTDDLVISADGDFAGEESTKMHQKQLLQNAKGSFKENPLVCVGAMEYLNDEDPEALIREISSQFAKDGMKVNEVRLVQDKIKTDAYYA